MNEKLEMSSEKQKLLKNNQMVEFQNLKNYSIRNIKSLNGLTVEWK